MSTTAISSKHIQLISDMFAAFGSGDVQAIVSNLTDTIQWHSYLDPIAPWAGSYNGKAAVPRFFHAIYESVDVIAFEPNAFYEDGDVVISRGRFECRNKSNGKSASVTWVFIFRFEGDKLASYEQYQEPALADIFRN